MIQVHPYSENPAADGADCFIGTAAAIILAASAAASTTGSIYAAKKAGEGAKLQTDATNHAADVQSATADKTLAYQNEQSALDRQTAETNRRADYDQWAAREGRLSSIGEALGLAPRNIPGYVPLPSAQTTPTSGNTPTGATPQGMPNGIDPRFAALYTKYGVTPGERGSGPADWQYYQNDAVRNANGDVNYILGRLETDLQRGGSGSGGTQSARSVQPASSYLGGSSLPFRPIPITPALQLPGATGSYLG